MAKVKYDVSGVDPKESATRGGNANQAPKGVYMAKIVEATPGFARGDNGKPDKSRPNVKIVLEPRDGKKKYAYVYTYLTFGEASLWKLDQFLQAVGIASGRKRKGEFDTDKLVGKEIGLKVKPGTDNDGDYRAEAGTFLNPKEMETDLDDDDDDEDDDEEEEEEETEDDDEEESDDEDEEEDDDEDEEEDDEESAYTEEELKALKPTELKSVAKELGVKIKKDAKKGAIVKAILASQEEDDEDLPF